jgi:hypothetical protein
LVHPRSKMTRNGELGRHGIHRRKERARDPGIGIQDGPIRTGARSFAKGQSPARAGLRIRIAKVSGA